MCIKKVAALRHVTRQLQDQGGQPFPTSPSPESGCGAILAVEHPLWEEFDEAYRSAANRRDSAHSSAFCLDRRRQRRAPCHRPREHGTAAKVGPEMSPQMPALRMAELPSLFSAGANAITPPRKPCRTESARLDSKVFRVCNRASYNQLSGSLPDFASWCVILMEGTMSNDVTPSTQDLGGSAPLARRQALTGALAAGLAGTVLTSSNWAAAQNADHAGHAAAGSAKYQGLIDAALACVNRGEVCIDHCAKQLGTATPL
jgi:hypothetical protein